MFRAEEPRIALVAPHGRQPSQESVFWPVAHPLLGRGVSGNLQLCPDLFIVGGGVEQGPRSCPVGRTSRDPTSRRRRTNETRSGHT